MTDDTHQGFSAAVWNRDKEGVSQLTLHSTENPLLSQRTPPSVLAMTKLAFVDFDDLVGAANPLSASRQVFKHGLLV